MRQQEEKGLEGRLVDGGREEVNADMGMVAQGKGRAGIWQLPREQRWVSARRELGFGGNLRARHREKDLGTAESGESEEQSGCGRRARGTGLRAMKLLRAARCGRHGHSLEKSPHCHCPLFL